MDCFALLDAPRRPWLEAAALKQKFLALSATAHPDRVHAATAAEKEIAQQRFTDLNHAFQTLRDPKERLQHLLELETGAPPAQVQRVPDELMALAVNVGHICRQVDAFLDEKALRTSPLLQVEFFERGQEWLEKLKTVLAQMECRGAALEDDLRSLDAKWTSATQPAERPDLLARLEAVYRLLSYYNRWRAQLQERITRLSF